MSEQKRRTTNSVAVVMATYNGARHVSDQIQSIIDQSVTDWTLYIRDDGSTDGTQHLVNRLANTDRRIRVLADDRGNVGVVRNFEVLLSVALSHDYVFFSDQDDLWDQGKLERQIAVLNRRRPTECAAVFCDYRIIDVGGVVLQPHGLAASYIRRLPQTDLVSLLGFDYVWGCTLGVTKSLAELALPFPPGVVNHDYWLALLAAADGSLMGMNETLVSYRKHDANVTGNLSARSFTSRLLRYSARLSTQVKALSRHDRQVADLRCRLLERSAAADAVEVLDEYVQLAARGPIARLLGLQRMGVRMLGPWQELARAVVIVAAFATRQARRIRQHRCCAG